MNDFNIPHETFLCHFDNQVGPKILISGVENSMNFNVPDIEEITRLMDIHEPGDFFAHYFNGKMTVNYCFKINDSNTRGGEHLLMTTMAFDGDQSNIIRVFHQMGTIEKRIKLLSHSLVKNGLIKTLLQSNDAIHSNDRIEMNTNIRNELVNALIRHDF
jgi:hypothetical protein